MQESMKTEFMQIPQLLNKTPLLLTTLLIHRIIIQIILKKNLFSLKMTTLFLPILIHMKGIMTMTLKTQLIMLDGEKIIATM